MTEDNKQPMKLGKYFYIKIFIKVVLMGILMYFYLDEISANWYALSQWVYHFLSQFVGALICVGIFPFLIYYFIAKVLDIIIPDDQ